MCQCHKELDVQVIANTIEVRHQGTLIVRLTNDERGRTDLGLMQLRGWTLQYRYSSIAA